MTVKLSFDERKWLLKCYWNVENVEVQRRWSVKFGTPPPSRLTITRIRDKFEDDGTVQDVLNSRCERNRSSISNNPDGMSLYSTLLGVYCGRRWRRTRWSSGYHTRLWIGSSRVRSRPGSIDFSERKNPDYDFLRKGSKAVGPVS